MNVLVTGHQGYIGSILTGILKEHGHTVTGFDTGFFKDGVLGPEPIAPDHEIRKDIREAEESDLAGFGAVIHLAALSDDPIGELDPELTSDINLDATVRLAELAKRAGVGRLLFSSSTSVYGLQDSGTVVDESSSLAPITAYAKSKAAAEHAIGDLADDGFTAVCFRSATAYGASPRIRVCTLVVHNLMGAAIGTGRVLIKSDGSPWRPLVHVSDICRAFAAALVAPAEAVHNQVFNVGQDGENFQIRDIAEAVRLAVPGSVTEYTGEHGADRRSYRVSFAKIASGLPGFNPEWRLAEGCADLYRFLTENGFGGEMFRDHRFLRLPRLQHLMSKGLVDERLYWRQ